ncbi:KAP family NTPase [Echinicola marina]|uniref:P-loop NTPase fold protein n=1 Tax=Echinicola marina TaxID=2859768 RepID=UPI001CF71B4C|nr:P-loop NTPase fold protein [Echinicola marina]UCS94359.1 KAP family NTPase [Echinicola marina]
MDNQLEIGNVSNVVAEYLKERPVGAILINGKWGSGKTHFWKNHLSDLVKKNKLIPVYVSLNGINSIKDLEQQTIIAFVDCLPGKFLKKLFNPILNSLDVASEKYIGRSLGEVIKGLGLHHMPMEKCVICFDDLERCKLPIAESLGFINRFLEHQYLKTIIMADESEIPQTEVEEYNKKKEKVISRVLGFEVDIPEIITILSQTRKGHTPSEKLLNEHKNFITDFLQEYQEKNLRVLMFWTYILDRIAPEVLSIQEKDYQQEILLFAALIVFEFKNGGLKDFKETRGLDKISFEYGFRKQAYDKSNGGEQEKKDYSFEFYEKYIHQNARWYHFYPSIFKFILTGYFDKEDLIKEIKGRIPPKKKPHEIGFEKLLRFQFRDLDDKEFQKWVKVLWENALKGKYTIYQYPQITLFFHFFSDNGLVGHSEEEIKIGLIKGLELAADHSKTNDYLLENLLHFTNEDTRVEEMKKEVEKMHNKIFGNEMVEKSKTWGNKLLNMDENELNTYFEKYRFDPFIFRFTNPTEFGEAILKASGSTIRVLRQLMKKRYSPGAIKDFLSEEQSFLTELKDFLKVSMDKEIKPLRKFNLNELIEELDHGIAKLGD